MALQFKNIRGLKTYTEKMKHRLQDGEMAICEDDGKCYMWHKEWQEIKLNTNEPLIEMSLYDLNSQIISQLPDHDEEQLEEDIELINQYDLKEKARYYMLLCKEYSYYTIFNLINSWTGHIPTFGQVVKECLDNVGTIRSCDYDNIDNPTAIEIWVHTNENEVHCFHLFPYDIGVVEFMRGE